MEGSWQAGITAAWIAALVAAAPAGEGKREFDFNPPVIGQGLFNDKLGMLDRERGEYATNLATYAANRVAGAGASTASLAEARRLLALAMHLSPRNRKALVINYQLREGVMPESGEGIYSAGVFARLLLTRAQLLLRDGGAQDELLARAFIELAAEMDPRNEDAVYTRELQRLDHGEFDWSQLTDPKPQKPVPEPPPPPSEPTDAGSVPERGGAPPAPPRPAVPLAGPSRPGVR